MRDTRHPRGPSPPIYTPVSRSKAHLPEANRPLTRRRIAHLPKVKKPRWRAASSWSCVTAVRLQDPKTHTVTNINCLKRIEIVFMVPTTGLGARWHDIDRFNDTGQIESVWGIRVTRQISTAHNYMVPWAYENMDGAMWSLPRKVVATGQ